MTPSQPSANHSLERADATLVGTTSGDGPPVLLLHAGGERRQVWSPVQRHLAAAGLQSVAYDQRGHGETTTTAALTLSALSGDVDAMLRHHDHAVVAGASLGGLAGILAVGEAGPDTRADGLVLLDVVPNLDRRETTRFLGAQPGDLLESPFVEDALGHVERLCEAAARFAVPVLLLRAGHSPISDLACERFQDLVPSATVDSFPTAGHLMARDEPAAVAGSIARFSQHPDVRRRRTDRLTTEAGLACIPHPGGTLGEHLRRTGDLLRRWRMEPWIEDAGRVHAIYETDGFAAETSIAVERETVTAAIGSRAEALVTLYGTCDRERSLATMATDAPTVVDRHGGPPVALDASTLRAFVHLTVANELDALTHSDELRRAHGAALADLFDEWLPMLNGRARNDVRRTVATWHS
ncbi:MAG: alpha/beta fold hydrolase [Acidimicrobiales bacterium]